MPPSPRPRRSELATPASNDDMFAKAAASGADLVFPVSYTHLTLPTTPYV